MDDRKTFLINMYNQMFNDINRHIIVTWQAIGVIGSSVAILALIERAVISVQYAISLIITICFWGIFVLIDSVYWYNRNLVIIANIERQFLDTKDLKEIHYYFGKHRRFCFIEHLRAQLILMITLIVIFLSYNFAKCENHICNLPNILAVILTIISIIMYLLRKKTYNNFLKNSPGKTITGSQYIKSSIGHPTIGEEFISIEKIWDFMCHKEFHFPSLIKKKTR